ncbi:MAG: CbiQ family ECF transporter T component [Pseudorhodobacter sp.]
MLTLTSDHETPLHRLAAGVKLAMLAGATALLMMLPSATAIWFVAGLVALGHMALGRAFAAEACGHLFPLWPFLAVLALWHLWTGEAAQGAVVGGRLVVAVALANLVTMTTRLTDMMEVVETLTRPFARFGLSPRRLALALALVLRFTPMLMTKIGQLGQAWRARSARRRNGRILTPVLLAALDDAEQLAEALKARGGI